MEETEIALSLLVGVSYMRVLACHVLGHVINEDSSYNNNSNPLVHCRAADSLAKTKPI